MSDSLRLGCKECPWFHRDLPHRQIDWTPGERVRQIGRHACHLDEARPCQGAAYFHALSDDGRLLRRPDYFWGKVGA